MKQYKGRLLRIPSAKRKFGFIAAPQFPRGVFCNYRDCPDQILPPLNSFVRFIVGEWEGKKCAQIIEVIKIDGASA